MEDLIYQNNIEYLKQNGWVYAGDRYTNRYCELWCMDIATMSGGTLANIVEDAINPLIEKIKEQEVAIEKQQKILKKYNIEDEIK